MFPVHHYTAVTRELSREELRRFRLDYWRMRYEERFLPVSTSVTPSGRFMVRVLLGLRESPAADAADALACAICHIHTAQVEMRLNKASAVSR